MSDTQRRITGGRIIMGLQSRNLDEVSENLRNSIRIDTPETEEKFLERVREKAKTKASEVINNAMAEARKIRQKARDKGHREGMDLAEEEIRAVKDDLASNVGKIFSNLKKEKKKIWEGHRQDMVLVLKASVERILGIEMRENRHSILESLLDQSLDLVESSKELSLTVSKDDMEIISELLDRAGEKHPIVNKCRVKSSNKIKKGGLILENGNGIVDNTLDSRYEQIKKIVEQISLSEEDA